MFYVACCEKCFLSKGVYVIMYLTRHMYKNMYVCMYFIRRYNFCIACLIKIISIKYFRIIPLEL